MALYSIERDVALHESTVSNGRTVNNHRELVFLFNEFEFGL